MTGGRLFKVDQIGYDDILPLGSNRLNVYIYYIIKKLKNIETSL
jgi:hypothetical protein